MVRKLGFMTAATSPGRSGSLYIRIPDSPAIHDPRRFIVAAVSL